MNLKKNIDLELIILTLLKERNKISLREIAKKSELIPEASKDRRAIQRVLAKLIKSGTIQALGKARARVYTLKNNLTETSVIQPINKDDEAFKDIFLSQKSAKLLLSLSKTIHTRKPVGYNQKFLRSYIPNQTSYLDSSLREELVLAGNM